MGQASCSCRQGKKGSSIKNQNKRFPKILLGAEVAFFQGISQAEDIRKLTIEGTDLLLLEMPFGRWSESDIKEVQDLIHYSGMTIIFAHLERFLNNSTNRNYIYELLDLPAYVQVNAGSLLHWRTRRKTARLLERKGIGLLGSDCHRINQRVPNLEDGRNVIKKMLGDIYYEQMDELGESLLLK